MILKHASTSCTKKPRSSNHDLRSVQRKPPTKVRGFFVVALVIVRGYACVQSNQSIPGMLLHLPMKQWHTCRFFTASLRLRSSSVSSQASYPRNPPCRSITQSSGSTRPKPMSFAFIKHLNKNHAAIADLAVSVETVDHPNDSQLLEYARKYFAKDDMTI